MQPSAVGSLRARVGALRERAGERRLVLAVSGGRDSIVLLDAAVAALPRRTLLVATFDHGTGAHATRAAAHVAAESARLGVEAVTGCADSAGDGEAAWRDARWRFLRDVAARADATIVTAHTRDDQAETVLMRVLRGSGARGLAGLAAPSDVLRPLLGVARDEIAAYADARRLRWIDDPTNLSRAHLRNRIRLDLLPALRAQAPSIDDDLVAIGERAAAWRAEVERAVDEGVSHSSRPGVVDVAASDLAGYSPESLAIIWSALAGRAGLALDWRGTRRLVEFTMNGRIGGRIQLSGGWEVHRARERLELHRDARGPEGPTVLDGPVRWGRWSFAPAGRTEAPDAWSACLPSDATLTVRRWTPGDSMAGPAGRRRKVTRLLSDAGVSGHRRSGWPVVVAGEAIVWIPGVRRSDAATDRSGRPGRIFRCEFHDR